MFQLPRESFSYICPGPPAQDGQPLDTQENAISRELGQHTAPRGLEGMEERNGRVEEEEAHLTDV
jgi:hypothetical protein